MSKTDKVMPIVEELLEREWQSLLKPFFLKRLRLYMKEIEQIQIASRPPVDYDFCDGVED